MKRSLIALAVPLAMAAFSSRGHAQATMPKTKPMTISDTQIAKVLLTINDGEIDQAKTAKSHAQNQAVKDFANMMNDQHQANTKETKDIAKKNKINPEDSDLAKSLKEEAKTMNNDLKRQEKMAFDKAYIKDQIAAHEKALATLKDTLIPSAQNPEFKAHLEKTSAAVSEHLAHAKSIEAKL